MATTNKEVQQRAQDNADEIWATGSHLVGKVVKVLFVMFLLLVGVTVAGMVITVVLCTQDPMGLVT